MSVSALKLNDIITNLLNEYHDQKAISSDELMDKIDKFDLAPEQIEEIYKVCYANDLVFTAGSDTHGFYSSQGNRS